MKNLTPREQIVVRRIMQDFRIYGEPHISDLAQVKDLIRTHEGFPNGMTVEKLRVEVKIIDQLNLEEGESKNGEVKKK